MPNTPRFQHHARQDTQAPDRVGDDQHTDAGGNEHGRAEHRGIAGWLTRSGGEGIALLGAAAIFLVVVSLTVSEAVTSLKKARELSRVVVTSTPVGDSAQAYEVRGRDSNGASALFDIIVTNRSLAWKLETPPTLERNGTPLPHEATPSAIFSKAVIARLSACPVLIAVGNGPGPETGRTAAQPPAGLTRARARQAAVWMKQTIPGDKALFTLDLGRTTGPCERCETAATNWERPLILIGVREIDRGIDLRQALMTALARTRNLPSPTHFSRFDLTRLPS